MFYKIRPELTSQGVTLEGLEYDTWVDISDRDAFRLLDKIGVF